MEEIIAHYDNTIRSTFFSQLNYIKQKGSMVEHIEDFHKLNIRINDIPKEHRIYVFIWNLKDNIQHEVHLWETDSLEKAFRVARKFERKIMATSKSANNNYKYGNFFAPSLPQTYKVDTTTIGGKKRNRALLQLL